MVLKKSLGSNHPLFLPFLSLFTSFSTLICCALPALFVSLGLGATLMGLVSDVPQLIWVSENKSLIFGLSFALLALSIGMQYRARNLPCPIDPKEARACTIGRRWAFRITIFSVIIWMLGASFAFVWQFL